MLGATAPGVDAHAHIAQSWLTAATWSTLTATVTPATGMRLRSTHSSPERRQPRS